MNIREFTETNNRLFFDNHADGIRIHSQFEHTLLTKFFGKKAKSQEFHLANNKVVYLNTNSLNSWKKINGKIPSIQIQFNGKNKLYGFDASTETFYSLIKNIDNTWDEIDYKKQKKLGQGISGSAYKMTPSQKSRNGKQLKNKVVKVVSPAYAQDLRSEDVKLRHLHQNEAPVGVQLPFKMFIPGSIERRAFALMKQYDGSVERIVSKMSFEDKKSLMRQLILGLKQIHAKKIAHADIKLDNILFKDGPGGRKYYLADFGFSTVSCPFLEGIDSSQLRLAFAHLVGGKKFANNLINNKHVNPHFKAFIMNYSWNSLESVIASYKEVFGEEL